MRKALFWLNDEEWRRIEPLLPNGRRGAHRVDDRRVISGIFTCCVRAPAGEIVRLNTGPIRQSTTDSTAGAGKGIWRALFKAITGTGLEPVTPAM